MWRKAEASLLGQAGRHVALKIDGLVVLLHSRQRMPRNSSLPLSSQQTHARTHTRACALVCIHNRPGVWPTNSHWYKTTQHAPGCVCVPCLWVFMCVYSALWDLKKTKLRNFGLIPTTSSINVRVTVSLAVMGGACVLDLRWFGLLRMLRRCQCDGCLSACVCWPCGDLVARPDPPSPRDSLIVGWDLG